MTWERGRGLLPALVLGLLLAPGIARSQAPLAPLAAPTQPAPAEPAPAPEAAKPAPPPAKPQPIPLQDVAKRGDQVDAFIGQVDQDLRPPPQLALIQESLPRRREKIAEQEKRLGDELAAVSAPFRIATADHTWAETTDELDQWQSIVTQRLTDLGNRLATLQAEQAIWALTAKEARAAKAPAVLRDGIADVRRKLDRAGDRLSKRRDELFNLQSQVAELQDTAKRARSAIEERQQQIRSSLFVRENPPLWRALAEVRVSGGVRAALVAVWTDTASDLASFAAARPGLIALHIALILLTAGLALAARRRATRWSESDPRRARLEPILERPISTAFLVGVIAAPLVYAHPPPAVGTVVALIALLPMTRLLPRLAPPSVRPAFIGLAALMAANLIRHSLDREPALERLVLFAETVAAAGYLVSVLRPAPFARIRHELRVGRWLGVVGVIGLLLLTGVALADLLGWAQLARTVGGAILASAVLGALLYGAARLLRATLRGVLGSAWAQRISSLRSRSAAILANARWVINAVAGVLWLRATLYFFRLLDPAKDLLGTIFGATAHFGTISVSLGAILLFAATLLVSLWLARFLREVLEQDVFPHVTVSRGASHATSMTVQYLIAVFGVVLAFGGAGVDFSKFTLLAGALGVGVGFGLQNIVENFIAGLILLYERPIQEGDTVEMGELLGEVRRIGIRSSTVRTWQGAEVIVPNSSLIADKVINWTLSDRNRRIDLSVGVAYGTDPKRVIDLLLAVARAHPDVLDRPDPTALFVGFGDSSLDFELRVWTSRAEIFLQVKSDLAVGVHGALAEAGITVPFPQRDLHLQSVDSRVARLLGRGDGEDETGTV